MKYIMLTLLIFSTSAKSAGQWTDWKEIGLVYTYTVPSSLHVYLIGETCPNTKNYFSITDAKQANAAQLVSMILVAKSSKKKVRVFYDPNDSDTLCYFKGLQIEQ